MERSYVNTYCIHIRVQHIVSIRLKPNVSIGNITGIWIKYLTSVIKRLFIWTSLLQSMFTVFNSYKILSTIKRIAAVVLVLVLVINITICKHSVPALIQNCNEFIVKNYLILSKLEI
jgi:hypothetical protein